MQDSKGRERELIAKLKDKIPTSEVGKLVLELLRIRNEKYKDELVKVESDVVRGRAQETRDLIKQLTENGGQ